MCAKNKLQYDVELLSSIFMAQHSRKRFDFHNSNKQQPNS